MAYIAMAYIAMANIVMANIVMAYIVMACGIAGVCGLHRSPESVAVMVSRHNHVDIVLAM